ncbi:MAG: cbb3-type cytochrome c oxidase subunit 3 [Pseudomonadota bacterium]
METYTLLREFADSWFLMAMFAFFVGTLVFAFWPSLRHAREDAASIPLRDEDTGCTKECVSCVCKTDFLKGVQNG